MWIKDPKTGQRSVSLTFALVSFLVVMGHYIASFVVQAAHLPGPAFNAGDALSIMTLTFGLYFGRKLTDSRAPNGGSGSQEDPQ